MPNFKDGLIDAGPGIGLGNLLGVLLLTVASWRAKACWELDSPPSDPHPPMIGGDWNQMEPGPSTQTVHSYGSFAL